MARSKATKAAPAAPPLNGCSIALSGTLGVTHAAAQESFTKLGAELAKTVTADTTYLISTKADVEKESVKVKAALKHGIPIVSIDWLDECAASSSHEDPKAFLLTNASSSAPASASASASAPAPTATRQSRSKAATASANASQAPPPAPAPTPAAAAPTQKGKGKRRAASPAPSPPPPATAPDLKKPKTAQTAAQFGEGSIVKSKNIVIPLDEGCPLTAYTVYIDDDGVVYDANLTQTNSSNNNNKFYRIQVCPSLESSMAF